MESSPKEYWKSFKNANNINVDNEDYKNILKLLKAFGAQFTYIPPGSCPGNMRPGLNICKNIKTLGTSVVLSKDDKQKIMALLPIHNI